MAQNAGAQAALQAAQQLMSASGGGVGGGMGEEPKTVLRVIIEHMLYPVTIDVLKQVGGAWAGTHTHTHTHTHTIDVLKQVGRAGGAHTCGRIGDKPHAPRTTRAS